MQRDKIVNLRENLDKSSEVAFDCTPFKYFSRNLLLLLFGLKIGAGSGAAEK